MPSTLHALHRRLATKITIDPADPVDGCWIWTGRLSKSGTSYGQISVGGRICQAHRVMYELVVAPIPAGLVLDHLVCSNRACVNWRHMLPATNQFNVWRGVALVNRGVCRSGRHDVEMTGIIQDAGYQRCRECRLESKRRYNQKVAA